MLNRTHGKIIDAVIAKAEAACPGALALIGVYGSAATGEMHEKSDLDLMILVNDGRGNALCDAFVLDDAGVGYDLYCTTWSMLEADALCTHAHLSKLLDSQIVYAPDPAALERLEVLRSRARQMLCSDERFEKARSALDEAKKAFADCCMDEDLASARLHAGMAMYMLLDALMLHGGRYFKLGVKRTFAETAQLALPFDLERMVQEVICARSVERICRALRQLMGAARAHMAHP
ncbi:MAG: nucleotidyltransferase domain-containing protein, partial [Eubacteriales bacterium]|nr:nucleotidyltransferase domain-containing protein [Eubacteriales bacterium]